MQMLNAHPRADCHQVGMNGQCSAIVIIMNLLHSGCLTSLTDMNSRVAPYLSHAYICWTRELLFGDRLTDPSFSFINNIFWNICVCWFQTEIVIFVYAGVWINWTAWVVNNVVTPQNRAAPSIFKGVGTFLSRFYVQINRRGVAFFHQVQVRQPPSFDAGNTHRSGGWFCWTNGLVVEWMYQHADKDVSCSLITCLARIIFGRGDITCRRSHSLRIEVAYT